MPYNKQTNPYGIASSELGWRGFADGGRMGNPTALAPPKDDIYKKLAVKAITDIGGAAWNEYTSPVNEGQTMWGDELSRFDTAIAAQKTPEAIEGAERAKRDFISSHPNAGKEIYQRPEWTDKVPDFLMPGGSRFNTPEGAINPRQAGTIRRNWKADPNFTPEAGPLAGKTVVKPVVKPDPVVDPNAVSTANAALIKKGVIGHANTPGFAQVNPEDSSLMQGAASAVNTMQLSGRLDDIQNSLFTAKPEFLMNDAELLAENKKDEVQSWMTGGIFSMSPAQEHFEKNPKEFAKFKANPVKWYYTEGPGKNSKKDYSGHSWFKN